MNRRRRRLERRLYRAVGNDFHDQGRPVTRREYARQLANVIAKFRGAAHMSEQDSAFGNPTPAQVEALLGPLVFDDLDPFDDEAVEVALLFVWQRSKFRGRRTSG